jgi:microcin C transport system permease protein
MWRPRFAPQTIEAWGRFRRMRRAWWSLWILLAAFLVSLGSELISNDRPLLLGYGGRLFFPAVRFYPATEFGGPHRTQPDYLALRDTPAFRQAGGWMVHPPVPFGPSRSELGLAGNPPHPPSKRHWLGTDNSARDVFSRLLYGFRISMLFALSLTACAIVLGVGIGSLQGYLGGKVDIAVQRFIEIWSALPMLYVVILLGSIYGQNFWMLLGVLTLFEWIGLSFYIRADCFRLKVMGYVQAARAAGAGNLRILVRHILPNAMTPLITLSPFMLIGGIGALTSLDFLGFGLPPPTPSWGELLNQGLDNLGKPWVALSALCALFFTLLLATFIGEGLREAFDPKSATRLR